MKTINSMPSTKKTPMDFFIWGSGSMCELGLGPKVQEVKRPRLDAYLKKDDIGIVDFAVGGMHTLALDKNNKIWSWGNNDMGVLGRNTSLKTETPIGTKTENEDSDSDDDDNLNEAESIPAPVEGLPKDEKIVQLAATDNMSLALTASGEIYAWGTFRNNEGVLGFSRDVRIQKEPAKIEGLDKIVQLATGKDHVLALDEKGLVYAWGNGQQQQLGRRIMDRDPLSSLDPRSVGIKGIKYIACGEYHSLAINKAGKVLVWGLNQFGQCGISGMVADNSVVMRPTVIKALTGKDIVSLAGGEHHTLAVSSSGDVYAFGRYDMKEIGIPESKLPLDDCVKDPRGHVRCLPVPTKLDSLPPIASVAAGPHHSLALTKDGAVYAWGFADTFAVGLGMLDDDVDHPTRINNTATRDHAIALIGCGGQFSASAGNRLSESEAEERKQRLEKYD